MDLRDQILKENSKKNWIYVVKFIGTDRKKFDDLMSLVFSKEDRVAQLSSQIMTAIADEQPQLLSPYLVKLVRYLKITSNTSVRRNTIRVFQFIRVPEEVEGELFEIGIQFLKSSDEPIGVKAFAMTALRCICEKYPDLAVEVIPLVEILVEEKVSPGIVHRGKAELKKLTALLNG